MSRKFVILMCCVLVSCQASKKVVYMQDADDGTTEKIAISQGIVIQPKDILNIIVSSRYPDLAMSFNLPTYSYQAGSARESYSYTQRTLGYKVDMEGNIDFPIFGVIKVAGLTRDELAIMIKNRLIDENLIRDPIVTTDFMNFRISVLGEVRNPGTIDLLEDRISLLEAIGRAGDLTIYGRRDNILVRREQNGTVDYYRVDLRSAAFSQSPAYYLQQNDVVYVEPNRTNTARSEINENKSLSIFISLASLLMSLAVLIIK